MRRFCTRFAPSRDPFKVLGLARTATKAEVKAKYRELARVHHPDAEGGDSTRMEEFNHAYKVLLKEGGYERLHLRGGATVPADAVAAPGQTKGVTSEARRAASAKRSTSPFATDQQAAREPREEEQWDAEEAAPEESATTSTATAAPHERQYMTDEEVERVSALDPSTERRTPNGRYLYQNRDDGTWVELQRPLLRVSQPRYASFAAQADMAGELRRRAVEKEREENEKTQFNRALDRLADSADLPTRNPHFLRLYVLLIAAVIYLMYKKSFARTAHQRRRHNFYVKIDNQRDVLMEMYGSNKQGLELSVIAAATVFLAASKKKVLSDPVVEPQHEVFFNSVRPPPQHFDVISSV